MLIHDRNVMITSKHNTFGGWSIFGLLHMMIMDITQHLTSVMNRSFMYNTGIARRSGLFRLAQTLTFQISLTIATGTGTDIRGSVGVRGGIVDGVTKIFQCTQCNT